MKKLWGIEWTDLRTEETPSPHEVCAGNGAGQFKTTTESERDLCIIEFSGERKGL